MKRTFLTALLSFASLATGGAYGDETAENMSDAASRFLASLSEAQRAQASFPFDGPERVNWHWIPRERSGVPIKELKPEQRALAFGLLSTGLSTKGMLKATTIMSLEEILRIEEKGTGPVRDPELYFVSVFGKPGDDSGWGWRMEGHHLSLNYTLRGGEVIGATPFMFGSNPAIVRDGSRKGLRNLAEIEAPVNELVASLTESQRKQATLSAEVPDVTTTPNSAQVESKRKPLGLSSADLTPEQRALVARFVDSYYANFPEPIHTQLRSEFAKSAQDFHFGWYGPGDPTQPHAFFVDGATFFIDFNDKQNAANHIHTFYRSKVGDFGVKLAQ